MADAVGRISKDLTKIGQHWLLLILIRENRILDLHGPFNPNCRVVPENTSIVLRAIVLRHFITNDSIRYKRTKTMRETWRHPELASVVRRKLLCDEPAIGGRAGADINCHIQQTSGYARYQFSLRFRLKLKMQPADSSYLRGHGMIILYERECADFCFEQSSSEAFHEIAA